MVRRARRYTVCLPTMKVPRQRSPSPRINGGSTNDAVVTATYYTHSLSPTASRRCAAGCRIPGSRNRSRRYAKVLAASLQGSWTLGGGFLCADVQCFVVHVQPSRRWALVYSACLCFVRFCLAGSATRCCCAPTILSRARRTTAPTRGITTCGNDPTPQLRFHWPM